MHATEFLKSVGAEKPPPVLLLAGPERMLRNQVISFLVRLHGRDGGQVELVRIDAGEVRLGAILEEAASGSLLASHRIIHVVEADSLRAPSGSPDLASLERYMEGPNPSSTLVLSAETANRARQPFKLLSQRAAVVECAPLRGAALRGWITGYLRGRGYAMHPAGAALIEELLGFDLFLVKNALDKVMLYCGERRRIEYEDLERAMQSSREHAIWELTNAIGNRQASGALGKLSLMLDEGKHPLQIAAALQNQIRLLIIIRSLLEKRLPRQEVIAKAGLRYRPDRVFEQARQFSSAELRRAHRLLFDLENSIKSAGPEDRFMLEACVLNICRARAAAQRSVRRPL